MSQSTPLLSTSSASSNSYDASSPYASSVVLSPKKSFPTSVGSQLAQLLNKSYRLVKENTSLIVVSLGFVFFGILNNVGAAMMAYVMPAYPAFLLYGTTIVYTLMFLTFALIRKEGPFSKSSTTSASFRCYLMLALWTSLNGMAFQFSDPYISGPLQQVLANLQAPIVFLMSRWWTKDTYRRRELVGTVVVFVAVLVGMVPTFQSFGESNSASANAEQQNRWYWVLGFVVSVVFGAAQSVQIDVYLRVNASQTSGSVGDGSKPGSTSSSLETPSQPHYQSELTQLQASDAETGISINNSNSNTNSNSNSNSNTTSFQEGTLLFWYNLLSLPFYLFSVIGEAVPYLGGSPQGTSVKQAFAHQADAFLCYFNRPTADDIAEENCFDQSWLWPNIFVVGYAGMFFLQAVLIKKTNAFFSIIVGLMVQPLSTVVFSWSAVVGASNYQPLDGWILASFPIILLGTLIKGSPSDSDSSPSPSSAGRLRVESVAEHRV